MSFFKITGYKDELNELFERMKQRQDLRECVKEILKNTGLF